MAIALCNPNAFYALRSLVNGPITAEDLPKIERFIRSILLHDDVQMLMDPWPDPGEEREWSEEEIEAGGRNVVLAVGPTIDTYEDRGLLSYLPYHQDIRAELDDQLMQLARERAGSQAGPYLDAHVKFIADVIATVRAGGSIVFEDSLANEVIEIASVVPEGFFDGLDRGWTEFLIAAREGDIGFAVPPFLAIVLNRCARRDAIPHVLADMKQELASARHQLWELLTRLPAARTIAECNEIKNELARAGEMMNPAHQWPTLRPVRMLWQIGVAAMGGAVVGAIARAPLAGGTAAAVNQAARAVLGNETEFRVLFRRGAFDLARRVNMELRQIARIPELLRPLLTDAERRSLGLA